MMQQHVVVTDKLKEKWRWEQEYVASNIVILEDEGNNSTSTTECILPGYECVSLPSDQHSSYYYGGVDVSFSSTEEGDDDEQAVAVYCILNQACEIVYLVRELFI